MNYMTFTVNYFTNVKIPLHLVLDVSHSMSVKELDYNTIYLIDFTIVTPAICIFYFKATS